jgi:hypothetical protein
MSEKTISRCCPFNVIFPRGQNLQNFPALLTPCVGRNPTYITPPRKRDIARDQIPLLYNVLCDASLIGVIFPNEILMNGRVCGKILFVESAEQPL